MTSRRPRIHQFYLWAYRLDEELEEGENLQSEVFGSLAGRFGGIRGRIMLTNTRLIYRSNSLRPGWSDQIRIVIPLDAIVDVEHAPRTPASRITGGLAVIRVHLADESIWFRAPQATRLVHALRTAIGQPGV